MFDTEQTSKMKNRKLEDKFNKSVNFVKPLYEKVKFGHKTRNRIIDLKVGSHIKLDGDDISIVNRKIVSHKFFKNKTDSVNYRIYSDRERSEECENDLSDVPRQEIDVLVKTKEKSASRNSVVNSQKVKAKYQNMLGIVGGSKHDEVVIPRDHKQIQADNAIILHALPDTWLRVYPAPKIPDESISSMIFRCTACQLGLTAFLILWTLIWDFVIFSAEGPYESAVSLQFQKKQTQLVIDLATELRQITPLSSKWRDAIERRIDYERQLTEEAVGQGARHDPGRFWDLPGTFLFTVYVMTALGFGAPVPQTLFGRTSTLVYAVLAVPTHIYLMVNASTCVVANIEAYIRKRNTKRGEIRAFHGKSNKFINEFSDSPTTAEGVKCNKLVRNKNLQNKILSCLKIIWIARGIPLSALLYYCIGVISFGVLRDRGSLETIMFSLEFTTTGGLERVNGHVRILYGLYVEGAMSLFACALASLRRHSGTALRGMSNKYRLFNTEECHMCNHNTINYS